MAETTLTNKSAKFNDISVTDLTNGSTDGVLWSVDNNDEGMLIVAYNSSADTDYNVVLKAPASGKGSYGSNAGDVTVEVGHGKVALIAVESTKYMDVTTGKVKVVPANAAVKFAAFSLK